METREFKHHLTLPMLKKKNNEISCPSLLSLFSLRLYSLLTKEPLRIFVNIHIDIDNFSLELIAISAL